MRETRKRWSDMTTDELAAATKRFDEPGNRPRAHVPSKRQLAQLRRLQRRSAARRLHVALSLDKDLVEQADDFAAQRGATFSEVVAHALRLLMRRKSA